MWRDSFVQLKRPSSRESLGMRCSSYIERGRIEGPLLNSLFQFEQMSSPGLRHRRLGVALLSRRRSPSLNSLFSYSASRSRRFPASKAPRTTRLDIGRSSLSSSGLERVSRNGLSGFERLSRDALFRQFGALSDVLGPRILSHVRTPR